MTYPQQPQYAPQGYAPQQYQQPYAPQQAAAPAPQQAAPQGYAPQQPFGGQGLPTPAPALGQSARSGEGGPKVPQPRHLIGRTVIFEPVRIDETTTVKDDNNNDVSRPTAYYHLTVVDGGPLEYGDNKSQKISEQHGFTMRTETPARFVNVSSDRWGIVQEIRDTMARGDVGSVGVIEQGTRGTKGSPPFLVTRPGLTIDGKERPDGDARFQRATAVWNAIFDKTFRSPEPVSLVAPPAQQPQQVAYAQPAAPQQPYQPTAPAGYAQQQYAQAGTVPTPYGAMPGQQVHPGYLAAATQPAYQPQAYNPAAYAAPTPQQPDYTTAAGINAAAANAGYPQQQPAQDPQYLAWLATQQPQQSAGPGL